MSHRGKLRLSLACACIVFAGCTATQLQSFNNGLTQINSTLGIPQPAGAVGSVPNMPVANDPGRIDSLDEILKAYVATAQGDTTSSACGLDQHHPADVTFYLQRANSAVKLGDDVTASASLHIAVATVAAQGVGVPGYPTLGKCVPVSQTYSPVGQWLASAVMIERRSKLLSAGGTLKIDAANALALLESDPVGNKQTIDSLIATGLVKKSQAHPTKKPVL